MNDNLSDRVGEGDVADQIHKDSEYVTFNPDNAYKTLYSRQIDGRPQRHFFYEDIRNGRILHFLEQEAYMQMKGSHRFFLRQIGVTTDEPYKKYLRDCGLKKGERVPLTKAQEVLRGAENTCLEAARGNFAEPAASNVYFDASFPVEQRGTFIPPQ